MNNGPHLSHEDLALYALQLLSEEELQLVAERLQGDSTSREEVARLQGDLVLYAMTAEQVEPPANSRERLLRHVAQEPRPKPEEQVTESRAPEPMLVARGSTEPRQYADVVEMKPRSRVAPALAWTGWAVAAGMSVAAGLQYQSRQQIQRQLSAETARVNESGAEAVRAREALSTLTDAGAMQVALRIPSTKEAPKPEGHAAYLAEKGSLVFIASHMAPLQSYKTYELWLLPASAGLTPIPAGLFKPDADGNASIVMQDLPKGIKAKGFGVTVEDEGGSRQPTPPILLAGT